MINSVQLIILLKNSHLYWHPSSHLNDTWSKSTNPCLIITWDGVVINGEHLYVDHIYYMIHVRPFGLLCSKAMSVHARLVKFNSSIPHVQNCLAPIVCEHIAYDTRSSRGVSTRRTVTMVHTLQKKTHPWHFGPNEFFSCHAYDTSMTIIVTKPSIIIAVVGSYFYDKKSWQKMGFSS